MVNRPILASSAVALFGRASDYFLERARCLMKTWKRTAT